MQSYTGNLFPTLKKIIPKDPQRLIVTISFWVAYSLLHKQGCLQLNTKVNLINFLQLILRTM